MPAALPFSLYCLSKAEFGGGIVDDRQALGEMIVTFHIK